MAMRGAARRKFPRADSHHPSTLAGDNDPDTALLMLAREHGVLPTLRLYAALAGCDYRACHVKGVGPATAIKLMQHHGLNVGAIAAAVTSGVHGASLAAETPLNWASLVRNVMDVFVNPIVYDPRSKTQQCMGGGSWEENVALLGGPIRRAHEAELRSLGMMRQDTGERIERQPVRNVLRMSELPDQLLFEMVPGSVSSSAL